jgi:hypothetical protein
MLGMMGKVNEENAAPEGRARSSTETSHQEATHPIEAPSLSLPKGGGAIRGIGEKFAANPVTGTGTLTVPIATSPGRAEFGPEFFLSYFLKATKVNRHAQAEVSWQ